MVESRPSAETRSAAGLRRWGEALPKATASKWELRVPKSPPRQLVVRAKGEKVSPNTLAITSLAEGLGESLAHGD
jgi:predicted HicB family RNase H-like nuclease